jgi:hypothetical protein
MRLLPIRDQQHSFEMAVGLAPKADEMIEGLAAWARPLLLDEERPSKS